ncbi:hypothetical protein RND71_040970 [Anisodus tanguticus]|uniref:Uncharacterized protein n=1 Tax=Anisodus tanguticus TaxID=243964 RepID=A0AAE1QTV3_9SOLA|nr:hypothetical protein RND71_040970 [Anisodus tanguticus]
MAIISSCAAATALSLSLTAKPISSSSTSLSVSTAKIPTLCSSSSLFFNSNRALFLGPARKVSNSDKKGLSCTCLFGLGVPELAVIAGVAALVFGPKQLPEVGRTIGKTVKSFQQRIVFGLEIRETTGLSRYEKISDSEKRVSRRKIFLLTLRKQAAKEFETELKKEPERPVEKAIEGSQEEKQGPKVSSTKGSS